MTQPTGSKRIKVTSLQLDLKRVEILDPKLQLLGLARGLLVSLDKRELTICGGDEQAGAEIQGLAGGQIQELTGGPPTLLACLLPRLAWLAHNPAHPHPWLAFQVGLECHWLEINTVFSFFL